MGEVSYETQRVTHLEELVIRQVFESEFTLTSVSRISLTQHSMAITWHHLARLESLPNKLFQLVLCHIISNLTA